MAMPGSMAFSKGMEPGFIWWIALKPALDNSSRSSTQPAIAITGMCFSFPICRIFPVIFPIKLCLSIFPSPVRMSCVFSSFLSNWENPKSKSAPDCRSAFKKADRLPPSPPAAPLPGRLVMSFPVSLKII